MENKKGKTKKYRANQNDNSTWPIEREFNENTVPQPLLISNLPIEVTKNFAFLFYQTSMWPLPKEYLPYHINFSEGKNFSANDL